MKLIFLFALGAFTFLVIPSCSNSNNDTQKKSESIDTTGLGPEKKISTSGKMDPDDAKELIRKFKPDRFKKGDLSSTVFDVNTLKSVFAGERANNIDTVRFFCAGYLKSTSGSFELIPLIIMQVRYLDSTAATKAYSYEYYSGNPQLCPPPDPCTIETESIPD